MQKVKWTKTGVCEKMEKSHKNQFRGVAISLLEWSLQMIQSMDQTCFKDDLIEQKQ